MTRINSSGSPHANNISQGEQKENWAPLRATSTVLRSLKVGVEGFTPSKFGWGHLHLSNGRAL
ncbi:MAG TPA: hypothetical protein VG742_06040, partial [Dongiaceae bacterium]|nr:hypothetical protein [Dongiaceae bacterium]